MSTTLSGVWTASNGNVDIVVIQNAVIVTVNWTQENPYWNYAAGTVKDDVVKMTFGGADQATGKISAAFDQIDWDNGSSWSKKS